FLDIQMPEIKGTEFAEMISKSGIRIIFTTAYSEYALQGFELSALDYLLKPITF
ncbi:MAG TPA: DNA-binding response regulator, partial [Flavobacteriaceae bacterium]|nr:DNA-binding response regulator [Flavobacteriaceae bacterium]